jgi:hypothetical protein
MHGQAPTHPSIHPRPHSLFPLVGLIAREAAKPYINLPPIKEAKNEDQTFTLIMRTM